MNKGSIFWLKVKNSSTLKSIFKSSILGQLRKESIYEYGKSNSYVFDDYFEDKKSFWVHAKTEDDIIELIEIISEEFSTPVLGFWHGKYFAFNSLGRQIEINDELSNDYCLVASILEEASGYSFNADEYFDLYNDNQDEESNDFEEEQENIEDNDFEDDLDKNYSTKSFNNKENTKTFDSQKPSYDFDNEVEEDFFIEDDYEITSSNIAEDYIDDKYQEDYSIEDNYEDVFNKCSGCTSCPSTNKFQNSEIILEDEPEEEDNQKEALFAQQIQQLREMIEEDRRIAAETRAKEQAFREEVEKQEIPIIQFEIPNSSYNVNPEFKYDSFEVNLESDNKDLDYLDNNITINYQTPNTCIEFELLDDKIEKEEQEEINLNNVFEDLKEEIIKIVHQKEEEQKIEEIIENEINNLTSFSQLEEQLEKLLEQTNDQSNDELNNQEPSEKETEIKESIQSIEDFDKFLDQQERKIPNEINIDFDIDSELSNEKFIDELDQDCQDDIEDFNNLNDVQESFNLENLETLESITFDIIDDQKNIWDQISNLEQSIDLEQVKTEEIDQKEIEEYLNQEVDINLFELEEDSKEDIESNSEKENIDLNNFDQQQEEVNEDKSLSDFINLNEQNFEINDLFDEENSISLFSSAIDQLENKLEENIQSDNQPQSFDDFLSAINELETNIDVKEFFGNNQQEQELTQEQSINDESIIDNQVLDSENVLNETFNNVKESLDEQVISANNDTLETKEEIEVIEKSEFDKLQEEAEEYYANDHGHFPIKSSFELYNWLEESKKIKNDLIDKDDVSSTSNINQETIIVDTNIEDNNELNSIDQTIMPDESYFDYNHDFSFVSSVNLANFEQEEKNGKLVQEESVDTIPSYSAMIAELEEFNKELESKSIQQESTKKELQETHEIASNQEEQEIKYDLSDLVNLESEDAYSHHAEEIPNYLDSLKHLEEFDSNKTNNADEDLFDDNQNVVSLDTDAIFDEIDNNQQDVEPEFEISVNDSIFEKIVDFDLDSLNENDIKDLNNKIEESIINVEVKTLLIDNDSLNEKGQEISVSSVTDFIEKANENLETETIQTIDEPIANNDVEPLFENVLLSDLQQNDSLNEKSQEINVSSVIDFIENANESLEIASSEINSESITNNGVEPLFENVSISDLQQQESLNDKAEDDTSVFESIAYKQQQHEENNISHLFDDVYHGHEQLEEHLSNSDLYNYHDVDQINNLSNQHFENYNDFNVEVNLDEATINEINDSIEIVTQNLIDEIKDVDFENYQEEEIKQEIDYNSIPVIETHHNVTTKINIFPEDNINNQEHYSSLISQIVESEEHNFESPTTHISMELPSKEFRSIHEKNKKLSEDLSLFLDELRKEKEIISNREEIILNRDKKLKEILKAEYDKEDIDTSNRKWWR